MADTHEENRNPVAAIRLSILVIMLFQLCGLFVRSYLQIHWTDGGMPAADAENLSALVGFTLLAALMAPALWPHRRYIGSLFARPESWPKLVLTSTVIGVLLVVVSWGFINAPLFVGLKPLAAAGYGVRPLVWLACAPIASIVLGFVVMGLMTPVVEEIINRGVILPKLLQGGRWRAILLSALLFTVLHKQAALAFAFCAGVVFAWQAMTFKTLWAPLISHVVTNSIVVLDETCLQMRWWPEQLTPALIAFGVSTFAVAVVCLAIAYRFARNPAPRTTAIAPPRAWDDLG